MEKNLEQLHKIYKDAFDHFKKHGSKKDKNYQKVKESYSELSNYSTNFTSFEKIRYYSLILSQPFEQCDLKITEKIITTIDKVLSNNILDSSILKEMISNLLKHLHYSIIFTDDNFNNKILNLSLKIYTTDSLNIHNKKLKYILKIILNIFLLGKNTQIQQLVRVILTQIIEHMIKKINNCLYELNNGNYVSKQESRNYCNDIAKLYLNIIVDLIDIANNNNSDNNIISLIEEYLRERKKSEMQKLLEALKLNEIKEGKNEIDAPIGKYGWCAYCRNSANEYNDVINMPICSNGQCVKEIHKLFNNIDNEYIFINNPYRKDYIILISYLIKYSSTELKGKKDEDYIDPKCYEFCLEMLLEMIDKGAEYFSNDEEVIKIIKDNLMDSLVKNTLSNAVNSLKLSFKLFTVIIKKYRVHLKPQIDIFFNKVLLVILESENMSYEYKVVILDTLNDLVTDNTFLVEIYVNFDCDMNYKAVFYEVVNLLTKIINGLYKKQKYTNLFKPTQEKILKIKCFDFLSQFTHNISGLVEKNINEYVNNNIEKDSYQQNPNANENLNETPIQDTNDLTQTLKVKSLLSKAIIKFNIHSPSKCLDFLIENTLIFDEETFTTTKEKYIQMISNPNDIHYHLTSELNQENFTLETYENINIMQTPFISNINPLIFLLQSLDNNQQIIDLKYNDYIAFEMARFIKSNIKILNREKAGEYLCSGKDFNKKVLEYFINSFDFKKLHIIEALRALFTELHLVGESQIVDHVVQIFGYKFHKENPNFLKNPDICYYLSYSIIILNTDLHREEVEKKMTSNEYINNFSLLCPKNENIPNGLLEDVYNRVLNTPLMQSGHKINTKKNKQELIREEKANIIKSTVEHLKTHNIPTISNNYNIKIYNRDIANLLECSWSNFLGIFSQLLADFDDEKIIITCINNILTFAGTCLRLHLDTIAVAFINTIINAINLYDGREITQKSIECIIALINFAVEYGQYIHTCWYNILLLISKIDFYISSTLNAQSFKEEIARKSKAKNIEREIEIEKKNGDIIKKCKLDMKCDSLYAKTNSFNEQAILNFVDSLCKVSQFELSNYLFPRIYSLHKLVEVADFNIYRIQIEWVKIWKIISHHLTYVITTSKHEMIWREALDSLKQTICKLLQKVDLSIYNFQKDFFKPFEVIFSITVNSPQRGEMILNYIYYIVGTYTKFIHSGWIVIFDILKEGLKRKNDKMNNDIKSILQWISDDFSLFNRININAEVFTGYIECLCHMYLDVQLKQYAFDTILNLINKIMYTISKQEEDKDKDKKSISEIEKKYEFFKIFFYGFDALIKANVIEHLNLLFETLIHNKDIIFSSNEDSFFYLYHCYFKPHLVMLLFYPHSNILSFLDVSKTKFKYYHLIKEEDAIEYNINFYLQDSIDKNIKVFKGDEVNEYSNFYINEDNNIENKKKLIFTMKVMKKCYNKDSEFLISKKLKIIQQLDIKDYKIAINFFIEKILTLLLSIKEKKINYFFFYEDLLLTMQFISIFNVHSDIILKILSKCIKNIDECLSGEIWIRIQEQNLLILSTLTTIQKKLDEHKFILWLNYSNSFIYFIHDLLSNFYDKLIQNDTLIQSKVSLYKLLNTIQMQILHSDIENNYKDFSIQKSKIAIGIISLIQKTKYIIIQYTKHLKKLSNNSGFSYIEYYNIIFDKYNLSLLEESNIFEILLFELDNIIPKFLNKMKREELEILFISLINFIDCKSAKIRSSSKTLLKKFINDRLCIFNPCKEE